MEGDVCYGLGGGSGFGASGEDVRNLVGRLNPDVFSFVLLALLTKV